MPALIPRLALLALLPAGAFAQTYVDLSFANNVQPANELNPNGSTLGPNYTSIPTLDFTNAGVFNGNAVDVRVSLLGLTDGEGSSFRPTSTYQWVGWLPYYNNSFSNDDLGVYYRHDGNFAQQTGGIAWSMSFFEGGGTFSSPIELPGVRLLIYDHDGEPFQSEAIRAFTGDGLVGYQLHQNSGITALNEDGSIRFNSRGLGHPETTADGGMILYYQNTSSIRFDMFSTTSPGIPVQNLGLFAAWDGNLGVNGGGTTGFHPFVAIPEPSTALLGVMATGLLLRRRRTA